MKATVMFRKKEFKYDYDPKTTVGDLINRVREDNKIQNTNFGVQLDGRILKHNDLVSKLQLKDDSVILMNIEAAASAQPVRRRICIPRRTDIDSDMKRPPDIEDRINKLKSLFPPGQEPDNDTILTALENSYWNLDRAVDYLFPPNDKPESPLTAQQKKDIHELIELGYTPGIAIQVYFASSNLEQAKELLEQGFEKGQD